jgi:hypothetical protein
MVVGVLAAGALVAGLVVTGRTQHLPAGRPPAGPAAPAPVTGTTPASLGPVSLGAIWTCPLLAPVPAFADHHSYPAGHPGAPPRGVRPAACFQSVVQAAAAGYPPAPPPAGTLEIGGIYLVPTGSRLQRRCQKAADTAGFAVPCPTLLPAMSPNAVPPAPCDQQFLCEQDGGFVLEQEGFLVPPGYVAVAGQPQGRLVVAASRRADDPVVGCEGRKRLLATVTLHGIAGQLVRCGGPGVHYDSTLVRWRERDAVMAVSVLGHTRLQQRLALAVAEHTRVIPPSAGSGGGR